MRRSLPSWFDTLRGDRGLFALVGALAILISMLQPVVAAQNAAYAGLGILCISDAGPSPDHQQRGPDCPLCPAGHLCANPASLATPAELSAHVFLLPATSQELRPGLSRLPGSPGPASLPSIRAPPLSA